jgi:hypothetical protein
MHGEWLAVPVLQTGRFYWKAMVHFWFCGELRQARGAERFPP